MSDDPQFRIATESDVDILLDFMQSYYVFDGHGFDREKARAALIPLLHNSDFGRAWLIFDADLPVGYIVICLGYSLEWLGRDAFVDEFYLLEKCRNRGWGQKTMIFLEQAARELGVRALHLEVMEGNNVAARLYRKIGFQPHHSTFFSKWIEKDFSKPPSRPRRHDSG
jgi:diamine N-acetyltransferase